MGSGGLLLLLLLLCAVLGVNSGPGKEREAAPPLLSAASTPAWVISLERAPWRLQLFRSASAATAIFPRLEVLPAIDGKQLGIATDKRVAPFSRTATVTGQGRRRHSDVATAGMIGLYLSHVAVWEAFLATGAPIGIVFEDDARVPADGAAKLEALLQELPPLESFDVWMLGLLRLFEFSPAPRTFGPNWIRPTAFFGTQAYLITRRGAQRMLDRALPASLQVDAFMATMSSLGEIVLVYRGNKDVNWGQMGLWTGTTVQNIFCDACDLETGFVLAADEEFWRVVGIFCGFLAVFVPRRWLTSAGACLCCCRCCSPTTCRRAPAPAVEWGREARARGPDKTDE